MDASPAEVFQCPEPLLAFGLGLPPAIEIAHQLRDRGLPIPAHVLTIPDLAEALC
jgi:hypothetical protein